MKQKAFFFCIFLFTSATIVSFSSPNMAIAQTLLETWNRFNQDNVIKHVQFLSDPVTIASRVTGYQGYRLATQYIYQTLAKYLGAENVFSHNYTVAVPLEYKSSIEVLRGEKLVINAYALWPNMVQCSPAKGLKGKLIYGGFGSLGELSGLGDPEANPTAPLKDYIVLLEFNGGDNWINCARLGAKAVVFIQPSITNFFEAQAKFSMVPLYFPRLWVSKEDGVMLKSLTNNNVEISITIDMRYENVLAYNIIGVLPGQNPNDIVILTAHYDTWSIVPSLAPGADDALGISVLLEIARVFSEADVKPAKTIWFLALSGHWQALAGAREFVEKYYFSDDVQSNQKRIWIMLGIDFSSDVPYYGVFANGRFYEYAIATSVANEKMSLISKKIRYDYLEKMRQVFPQERFEFDDGLHALYWGSFIPVAYHLDTEPASISGGLAFTVRTSRTVRLRWGTPLSGLETVNFGNLWPQAKFALLLSELIINEADYGVSWERIKPSRWYIAGAGTGGAGFQNLKGIVWFYNMTRGVSPYQALEHNNTLLDIVYAPKRFDPFSHIIVKAETDGSYRVTGLMADACKLYTAGTMAVPYLGQAFAVNPETGAIEWAPDQGRYLAPWSQTFACNNATGATWWPFLVFRCSTIVMYDLIDPFSFYEFVRYDLTRTIISELERVFTISFSINDISSHTPFISFGYYLQPPEPIALVFVPPEQRFELIFIVNNRISGVLLNSTIVDGDVQHQGFILQPGETIYFSSTHLSMAYELYLLNKYRLEEAGTYYVREYLAETFYKEALSYLNETEKALQLKDYEMAFSSAFSAWSFSSNAYEKIKTLILDVTSATIFFYAIVLIFAIVGEKLFLAGQGRRVVSNIIMIFIILNAPLYFLHPGFRLASNVYMLLLSFSIFILSLPVLGFLGSWLIGLAKLAREKFVGLHFTEISRASAFLLSISTGISNMRRRKFRTILTATSLVILAITLVALTSTSSMVFIRTSQATWGQPTYSGLLIKRVAGGGTIDRLPIALLNVLAARLGNQSLIGPRYWYLPPRDPDTLEPRAQAYGPNGSSPIAVFLGLSPEGEPTKDIWYRSLLDGVFLRTEDKFACLMSKGMAKTLGIKAFDYVNTNLGIELLVVGIFDETSLEKDLDGEPLNPMITMKLDPTAPATLTAVPWTAVLVIPDSLAKDLRGEIYSIGIGIKINDLYSVKEVASLLAFMGIGADMYISDGETVSVIRRATGYTARGWELLAIPLVIVSFITFNTLVGSIYERRREISIFSSVGLSPLHVAGMFFAEVVLYALISGVVGYLGGMICLQTLLTTGLMPPEFYPNYSSIFVISSLGILMGVTVLSSLYPTFSAARLVTPSLERKWKITTKPRGDEWEIPLPFMAFKEEIGGILAFMKEYFESHKMETMGTFVSKDVTFLETKEGISGLAIRVLLPPYDAAVEQDARLIIALTEENRYTFRLDLHRAQGRRRTWVTGNYKFVDEVRKQLLIWRGLTQDQKQRYLDMFSKS